MRRLAARKILASEYPNIHAVLIVRNGTLVVEEYFPGSSLAHGYENYDRDMIHELHSVTKSVNATLLGQAWCSGRIDLEESLAAALPEYAAELQDPQKRAIRLRHLLSMTAGLLWDEGTYSYTDPRNSHSLMDDSPDAIRYVLERPMAFSPGTRFVYNSGLSISLGRALEHATASRLDQLAERELFGPLGIGHYDWYRYPNGIFQSGGGLRLRPRDMAKIGQLYLDGGVWAGRHLLCDDWISEATRRQAPDAGYGYQWWLESFSPGGIGTVTGFGARGRGGQFIFVIPQLSLVAVFTGGNDDGRWNQPIPLMEQFILPAAR